METKDAQFFFLFVFFFVSDDLNLKKKKDKKGGWCVLSSAVEPAVDKTRASHQKRCREALECVFLFLTAPQASSTVRKTQTHTDTERAVVNSCAFAIAFVLTRLPSLALVALPSS